MSFGHVLLARKRVHQQQQFAVHVAFLHSIFGTSRARSMSASGIVCVPCAVSTSDGAVVDALQRCPSGAARRRSGFAQRELALPRPANRAKSAALRQRPVEPRRATPRAGRSRCSRRRTAASGGGSRARNPRRRRPSGLSMNTRTCRPFGDSSQSTSSYPIGGSVRSSSSPRFTCSLRCVPSRRDRQAKKKWAVPSPFVLIPPVS